jgi:hypothetical protein
MWQTFLEVWIFMMNVTQADVRCHHRRQHLAIIHLIKFPLHVHKRQSESNAFTTLFAYYEATKKKRHGW